MEEKRISLKIDLQRGVIELDAPADDFDQAIAKTMDLTGSLDFSQTKPDDTRTQVSEPDRSDAAGSIIAPLPASPTQSARVTRSGSPKPSAGRPGRIGSFEEVRDLLSEPKEKELRAFFAEKAPPEQTHKVMVAIVKGEQLLGRRGFTYNEIYTLLRLGGVKPLPKAIDVVLTRLMQDQFVVREGAGFAAKFLGREFVEDQLPLTPSNGS